MRVFLFPGCGSQYCGMGKEMFDTVPEYAAVELEIDRILGYSLRELCLYGPESRLKDTRYASPCMFVVNALYYYDTIRTSGLPHAAAGHSMGEYNALLAAGVIDIITGVRLVTQRAEIMASARSGAMAAVLSSATTASKRRFIRSSLDGFSSVYIAKRVGGNRAQEEGAKSPWTQRPRSQS